MLDKKDIKWVCQAALLESIQNRTNKSELKDYILNEATYEQLLNLCFTAHDPNLYLEAHVLEEAAIYTIIFEATEDKDKKKGMTAGKAAGIGAGIGGLTAAAAIAKNIGPNKKFNRSHYKTLRKKYDVSSSEARKKIIKIDKNDQMDKVKGTAGLIAVGALAGYGLYRAMRKKGTTQSKAAQAAATKAKTPEEKAKWQAKAKQAAAKGK